MKKMFVLFILLFGIIFSQQYEDVIYMKDGSVIKGLIIEQVPNDYIKIQSGQNVFVYQVSEIRKFTKEISSSHQKTEKEFESSNINNKRIRGISFGTGVLNSGNAYQNPYYDPYSGYVIPISSPKNIVGHFGFPYEEYYYINLSIGYGFGKSISDRNYDDNYYTDRWYKYSTTGFPVEIEVIYFIRILQESRISPFIGLGLGSYKYTTEIEYTYSSQNDSETTKTESIVSGLGQYFTFGIKMDVNSEYAVFLKFKNLGLNNILYKYDMLDSNNDEIGTYESDINSSGFSDLGMSIGVSFNY